MFFWNLVTSASKVTESSGGSLATVNVNAFSSVPDDEEGEADRSFLFFFFGLRGKGGGR